MTATDTPSTPTPKRELRIDPTFTFVEFEEKAPQRLSRGFWLQWVVLLGVGFAMLSILCGGFANMREYGWTDTGVNRVLIFSQNEKIFAFSLLAMLPLAIVAVLALEDLLARPCSRILGLARTAARRRVTLAALLLVTGATTFAATTWVLQDQAVTDDENVYLFQTRILAAGHLTLPSLSDEEPLRERIFEDNIFLVNNGKIFGQYPFGHSLALLPGYLLGWPHLMPLLFAVFSVLGLYLLTARLYGPPWALLAAFFLAVSPAFLATSATLLAHTSTLCFLIWFFYFAHRTWKERSWLNAVPTGLFFLLAFHMRSATTLLAAGPIGVALAVALLRDYRRQWPKIVVLGLLVVAAAALTLYFNYQANGDLFRTNYHAAWGEGKTPFKHPFGFGKGAWHLVHSPTQGLWNLWDNLLRLNWWLLGWPISLMFVFAWVLRRDKTALEWLGFSTVALTFFAYFFYFWPGVSDTGPVLYYELAVVLILLTISGLRMAPRLLLTWMPRHVAERRLILFVIFSTLVAWATFHQYQGRSLYRVSGQVGQLTRALDEADVPRNAVIFTNYYLKNTPDKNFQDSWVVGRPFTSRLLGDRRLFYVNYGRSRDDEFLAKHHPGVPGYVVAWDKTGKPAVTPLADYDAVSVPDNFPDSR
jgi:hypothetical protein